MLWSAALFFYVYYTPALPDCQRLPAAAKTSENSKTSKNSNFSKKLHPLRAGRGV